ncbi:hypothetical protein F5Y04DRAFT_261977 [Hypomontagnella monticulosa]|nr:hypothetical protein F5Y04DRAFT_261977 [Hypomontagnella monticulosa]
MATWVVILVIVPGYSERFTAPTFGRRSDERNCCNRLIQLFCLQFWMCPYEPRESRGCARLLNLGCLLIETFVVRHIILILAFICPMSWHGVSMIK